ncbi:MAG: hypothetical protein NT091_00420 [Candidatus Falkowbacteria bacterium]|nr:hypothetical protein [Candidatus Falkowbacteria bacterium]
MKILQINKFFYLKGGAERHFLDLSKLLEENGHAIIHFSMNDSRNNSSQFSQFFADKVDLDQFYSDGNDFA